MEWFAVRHLIQHEGSFEERITVWSASSAEEAITKAEAEAIECAGLLGGGENALGLFQSYRLPSPPAEGAEIFSLIRASALEPKDYVDRFFDTGTESQQRADS